MKMLHKLLKSIVTDINIMNDFDPTEIRCNEFNMFLEAIDKKIDCVKRYNHDLWCRLALECCTYREIKKIILAYLKEQKQC